ncbi:hypothetical protein [Streptomyces sp. NPDC018000]|uniref:hypothetical protein n=1 Tax=Streptomyces sp. NPDC018000 TaxID=3365028 RepID=UPI0037AB7219
MRRPSVQQTARRRAVLRADPHEFRSVFLQLMLIPSANNVARLLARWDSGSQAAFARKMQRN